MNHLTIGVSKDRHTDPQWTKDKLGLLVVGMVQIRPKIVRAFINLLY